MKSKFLTVIFYLLIPVHEIFGQCTTSISPIAPVICSNSAVTLTATGINGTFTWSPSTGLNTTNGNTVIASPSSTTIYQVIRFCPGGNSDTATVTVTVIPAPQASLIDLYGSPPYFVNCSGGGANTYTLTINDASTGSISNYFINWGDGTPNYNSGSPPNSISHTYNTQGFFNLTYIVTGANGCKDTLNQSVFNGSNPAVGLNIPANTNGCIPFTKTFPITGTAGNPPGTTYTISVNDGSPPTVYSHPPPASYTHTFSTNSCGTLSQTYNNAYQVQIVASNPCGTSSSIIVPIYISQSGNSDFTISPVPGCINQTVTFTNTSTNAISIIAPNYNCDSADRQNWIITPSTGWAVASGALGNANGSIPGSDILGVTFSTAGNYNVTLIIRGTCGNDTITYPVCITEPPQAVFSANPTQGCKPLNVSTINNSTVAFNCTPSQYNWTVSFTPGVCSINNGLWVFTNTTNATSISPSFQFQDAGVYNISLTATNVCGSTTDNQSISVGSSPLVSVTPIPSACGSITINPTATFNGCNQTISSYNWNFPGGSPLSSNLQTPPTITYSNITGSVVNYVVTANATNACGTGTDTAQFSLFPLPSPIAVSNPGVICLGQISQVSVNNSGNYNSINWNPVGTGSPLTVTPTVTTTYTATVTNSFGCTGSDTALVTVNPLPVVTVNSGTICSGSSLSLTAGGAGSYQWSTGATTNPITVSPTITTNYTVTGTNTATGCSNQATATVTVNPLPVVYAGNDTTFCHQPVQVQLPLYASPLNGLWSGLGIINTSGLFDPMIAGLGNHTLVYTYTDVNGCVNSDTIIVQIVTPAQAEAGPGQTLCIDEGVIQMPGFTPVTGGIWSGPGITNAQIGLFDPLLSGAGNFTLYYEYGSGSCKTTDSTIVIVNPLPVVNAGNDFDTCISVPSFTLPSYSPSGGTWSGNGLWAGNQFSPQMAGIGIHWLVYEFMDPVTGCKSRDSILAKVNPLPVPGFSVDSVLCLNTQVNLINTSSGATSVFWNFGDGNSSTLISPIHVYTSIGVYTIQQIVVSNEGCIDSVNFTVQVVEPPQPQFSLNPSQGCGPLDVNFFNSSSGYGSTLIWDFGNGISSNLYNPPTITYLPSIYNDTTYFITLTATNLCGSIDYHDSIIVFPSPTAYFGLNVNSGCSPLTISFSNNSYGLPTSFLWNFGDGTSDTSFLPSNHTFFANSVDTTYIITLTVSNQCGVSVFTDSILVHPNTVNAFFNTSPTQGCQPLIVNFTNFSTGGSIYAWDFGDGNISSQYSPSHTYTNPGIYHVNFVVNNGCSFDTSVVQINVWPQPVLNFVSTSDTVCVYQEVSLNNTSQDTLINIFWDFGDGFQSILSQPVHSYNIPGTYIITMIGIGQAFGCSDTIFRPIVVLPPPVAQSTASILEGCQPLVVNFSSSSIGASGYLWEFGDGNISTVSNSTNVFLDSGVYIVNHIVFSSFGCTDTSNIAIIVHPKPNSLFSFTPDSSCDIPMDFQLINQSSDPNGAYWDLGVLGNTTASNPLITISQVGNYPITLFTTNPYGCSDTSTDVIEVYPKPVALGDIMDPNSCTGYPLSITNGSLNGVYYFWDFGDGSNYTDQLPNHQYSTPGQYLITLVVEGIGGCRDTAIIEGSFSVFESPIAVFNYTPDADPFNYGLIHFDNQSIGASSFNWNFGDGNTSPIYSPSHQYQNYGDYIVTLVVSNNNNCQDTATLPVHVDYFKGLYVPNAFSPENGTVGVRKFFPKGKGIKKYRLEIYDGLGNLLWYSDKLENGSPAEGWDGTRMDSGVLLSQDVYIWKIFAEFVDGSLWEGTLRPGDNKYRQTGTITLIR